MPGRTGDTVHIVHVNSAKSNSAGTVQVNSTKWINSHSIVHFSCKTTRMQEQGETFEANVFISIWLDHLEKNKERGNKKKNK